MLLFSPKSDTCRQIFITLTLRNNAQIMGDILDIFKARIEPILNISKFLPSLVFQPLQLAVISNFKKNGGNALGMDESHGPLISKALLTSLFSDRRHANTLDSHGHRLHLG